MQAKCAPQARARVLPRALTAAPDLPLSPYAATWANVGACVPNRGHLVLRPCVRAVWPVAHNQAPPGRGGGRGRAPVLRAGGSRAGRSLALGPTDAVGERGRRFRNGAETADRNARTRTAADGRDRHRPGGRRPGATSAPAQPARRTDRGGDENAVRREASGLSTRAPTWRRRGWELGQLPGGPRRRKDVDLARSTREVQDDCSEVLEA